MGQGVIPGVCTGWPGANGASAGSSKGVSNISRIGFRNEKVQEGSFPAFCTLLGINLSGKAAVISEPTCKIVIIIARIISRRYPFKLRNRNLTMPSRIVCTGVEQASMETWLGYRMGMNGQETIRLSVKSAGCFSHTRE